MYELTGVTKTYKKDREDVHALRGIELRVEDGEFLSIQGPTGHGKTTLLQLLGGLDRPDAGTVMYDGRDLAQLKEGDLARLRAHEFGFVFQTFNLIPTLSAQENVETALVPLKIPTHERRQRAAAALSDIGLAERASHLPSQLSGGEQQRAGIARALVRDPRVILADEPTGNLDEGTRDEIVDLLEGLWRERGVTLIVVTHDGQVARRAQRNVRISEGRVAGRISEEAGR
jgi:putative ABC transport system ATP-binding protein